MINNDLAQAVLGGTGLVWIVSNIGTIKYLIINHLTQLVPLVPFFPQLFWGFFGGCRG